MPTHDRPDVTCLARFPYVRVRVACMLCSRKGTYNLARLAERYGANTPLDNVLEQIARSCRFPPPHKARGGKYQPRCYAYFPDLVGPPFKPPDLPAALMLPRLIQGGKGS